MNAEEKVQFVSLFANIAEVYGKKLSPEMIEVYWRSLMEYSLNEVAHALSFHVKNPDTGQFMPKPADVIRWIDGETKTKALRAWDKVISAIKAVGAYESIVFDDAIIHVVIEEMHGWASLCQTREEKLPFVANEFQMRYSTYLSQTPKHYPKRLAGLLEHQSTSDSIPAPKPNLYGDLSLAKQIYNSGKDSAFDYQIEKLSDFNKPKEITHDSQHKITK